MYIMKRNTGQFESILYILIACISDNIALHNARFIYLKTKMGKQILIKVVLSYQTIYLIYPLNVQNVVGNVCYILE